MKALAAMIGFFGFFLSATQGFSASNSNSKIFTFRMLSEPATLDWNLAHTSVETYVVMNLMEGLVGLEGAALKPVPALAKSWTRSEDGRTYTFNLRSDVKWSDGVPLNAKDFVYSWKRLLSPVTAAPYAYLLFDVEGAEYYNKGTIQDFNAVGVKALDDHTLQIKLSRPVAYWLYIPTFWVTFPMRQDIVEKHGNGWSKPGRMVTLGPFTLSVHDIETRIVLRANPTYYGKRGNVEQAIGLILKDDSTALSLYEAGKLDFMIDISAFDLKRLSGRPDLKTFPYLKTAYLGFAINNFPISNPKIRRAIGMAIDRKKIPEILHGGLIPANSFVPPKMMGHSATIGLPYDPVKAKQELKESGLDTSRPLRLEMLVNNWDKAQTVAQFIQNELKKNLGIQLVLQTFDHKTFRTQLDMHTYPLHEKSWAADYPDPDNFLSVFLGAAGNNVTAWKSQPFDDRVIEARNLLDPKARERAYFDAQKLLQEKDAVMIPLFYEPNVGLLRPRVKDFELNSLNYMLLKKVSLQ